jgi:hypothetical protein
LTKAWKVLAAVRRDALGGLNGMLGRAGLRLVRKESAVIDLRGETEDPITAAYRAGVRPFVIEMALADCRILPGLAFACVVGRGNPFIETLVDFAAGRGDYESSPLPRFYRDWRPQSAADVLGLGDAVPGLAAAPPLGFVMPWASLTPKQAEARWIGLIEADNREHGAGTDAAAGWKSWGPVSDVVGRLEYRRLIAVFESIRQGGYRRSDEDNGDIKAAVLCRGDAYAALVTAGHHRAAAAAASGMGTVPVRIDNALVRREDVRHWPNVRSGLYGEAAALALFDRLFEGRQPEGYGS